MNRNDIISYISITPAFKQAVYRICPYREFANDVYNDLIIKVYSLEESKLIDLYNKGVLLFYCIKIVQNEKGWKKYLPHEELTFTPEQEETTLDICDIAKYELLKETFCDKSDMYITKVTEHYIKSGSLRKLGEKLNIPYRSLGMAVNQFRDKIVIKHKQYQVFMAKNVLNDLPDSTKTKLYLASVKSGKSPEKLMEELIDGLDKGKPKTDSGKIRIK